MNINGKQFLKHDQALYCSTCRPANSRAIGAGYHGDRTQLERIKHALECHAQVNLHKFALLDDPAMH